MKHFFSLIDKVNLYVGRVVSFLIVPMVGILVFEVVMRYIFNKPTTWSHETVQYILGTLFILGGGYALLHKAHVNVDVLYTRFRPRVRAMVDVFTGLFFFLFTGVLLWKGSEMFWLSFLQRETSSTIFGPPIYPLKLMLALGALLIVLQGLVKFIKDLTYSIKGCEKL